MAQAADQALATRQAQAQAMADKEAEFIRRGLRSKLWPSDVLSPADLKPLRVSFCESKVVQ
eukprot:2868843-Alexandrium_andersonii.AAC.1